MTILWICGLPRGVRRAGTGHQSELSWVVGHLPPPEGVELHVLCPVLGITAYECFEARGATWHLFPLVAYEPLFLRRRFAHRVRGFVRGLRPDVVHGWGGETGWGLLATYFSRRAVVSVQGLLRMLPGRGIDGKGLRIRIGGLFRLWLERMTYRRAGFCLCESETAREALRRLYGVEGVVVPQPLRGEFFEAEVEGGGGDEVEVEGGGGDEVEVEGGGGDEVEVEGGGGERWVKFLFVGQDVPRKGIRDVREAYEKVVSDWSLVDRGRPKPELTVITGGKSAAEIAELMRTHDVFVLPSYGDTGPTAIKEALAMGMRVIAYDNTGPKELLERYGGTLVKTGDVAALAEAMRNEAEVEGGGGERRDEPQMTSSCAEFRPTRFAFDPANTRDGKRELSECSTSRHDIANSVSAVGCIQPGVGRTQFAKSACREATCGKKVREEVEVEKVEGVGRLEGWRIRHDLSREVVWEKLMEVYGRVVGG